MAASRSQSSCTTTPPYSSPNSSHCPTSASSPLIFHPHHPPGQYHPHPPIIPTHTAPGHQHHPLQQQPNQQAPPLYYVQSPRDSSASAHDDRAGYYWWDRRSTPYSSAPSSPLNFFYNHPALGEPLQRPPAPLNIKTAAINLAAGQHTTLKKAPYTKWAPTVHKLEPFEEDDADETKDIRKLVMFWCKFYLIITLIALAFAILVTWIACEPRGSQLAVENIEFLDLALLHGSDRIGVPTDMIFVKSRADLNFENPSRYFRMVFNPTLVTLSYLGVPIAHGKVMAFALNQESTHSIEVEMNSQEAPLYGAGVNFESSSGEVKTQLTAMLDVQVSILWNFIKRPFLRNVRCDFFVNPNNLTVNGINCD